MVPSSVASNPFDATTRAALEATLGKLASIDGVMGLTLIDRLGQPVVSSGHAHVKSEMLHTLAATLAGVGHQVVEELEEKPDVRVIARSDTTQVHVSGVDEEYLLVTLVDLTHDWTAIRPRVNETRALLREQIAAGASA